MQRSSVVLPEPDRPMIITASRCRTSRSHAAEHVVRAKVLLQLPDVHDRLADVGRQRCPVVAASRATAGDRAPIGERRFGHRSPFDSRRSSRSWKRLNMIVSTQ